MFSKEHNIHYAKRLNKLEQAVVGLIIDNKLPIVTHYHLFMLVRNIYIREHHLNETNLRLRKKTLNISDYERIRKHLLDFGILRPDPDYTKRAYRITDIPDLPADDICCLVDPFCHLSHLTAMQYYGLTNRRSHALHLTTPMSKLMHQFIHKKMVMDYGPAYDSFPKEEKYLLQAVQHPDTVRKRPIVTHRTNHIGAVMMLRGSYARIATIGQTFVDMLDKPDLCGDMAYVLDVWRESVSTYIDEIILAVNNAPTGLIKVRAGYILDEMLKMTDQRIESWQDFAQRGGTRRLDPNKPYHSKYSEKWMISINV